jgi:VIT1/CCC1 family predicted Fe2+/Mn2+ transporter
VLFCLFALGASIPVVPFFFLSGSWEVMVSAAFAAFALFGVGAGIALLTGAGYCTRVYDRFSSGCSRPGSRSASAG